MSFLDYARMTAYQYAVLQICDADRHSVDTPPIEEPHTREMFLIHPNGSITWASNGTPLDTGI